MDECTITIIDCFIFYILSNLIRSCHFSHKESRRNPQKKLWTLFIETSLLSVFLNSSLSLSPFTASRVSRPIHCSTQKHFILPFIVQFFLFTRYCSRLFLSVLVTPLCRFDNINLHELLSFVYGCLLK